MIRIHLILLLTALVVGCGGCSSESDGESKELSEDEISALLINAKESGEVISPSSEISEGQPGSQYTAEYFPDGLMTYTVNGEQKTWDYEIFSVYVGEPTWTMDGFF